MFGCNYKCLGVDTQPSELGGASEFCTGGDSRRAICTLADLAEVEIRRRGVIQAAQVGAVTAGADWRQGFLDLHRPDAGRMLDVAQAAQGLGAIADLFTQAGQPLAADWVHQQSHRRKHEGPGGVLEPRRA